MASYDDLLKSDDFEQSLLDVDLDVDQIVNRSTSVNTSGSSATAIAGTEIAGGKKRDGSKQPRDMYAPSTFGGIGDFMRNKRLKLDVQNQALLEQVDGNDSEDGIDAHNKVDLKPRERRPQVFDGCHVYINGHIPAPHTLRSFVGLLTLHGGRYVPYLDRKSLVTHIVAAELTPKKRVEFRNYCVVKPEWILACVEEGKKVDWRKWALLGASTEPDRRHEGLAVVDGGQPTQRAQRGLMSMFKNGNNGSASSAATANTETIESLSARGVRLAQASLAAVKKGPPNPYFRPRPPVSVSVSSTSSKPKAAQPTTDPNAPPDIQSDLPEPVGATTHSWLPRSAPSDRTTALLNDPAWMAAHTSASADFLQGYFQQSRLHHLSTWKEELKTLVSTLQPASNAPVRKKRLTGTASDDRLIFHVDFDCFFVSAGLTTRPWLKGVPVAVCHAKSGADAAGSTSEIASCSYEARAKGVKNGMSLGRARELCEDIQTIPFEFDVYKSIASKFYGILLSHALYLQAVSIDEVLMEVRPCSSPLELAHNIRDEIRTATGCEASIGIAHNILLARLASRKAKPANAFHLHPDDVSTFLEPLNVDSLPGIGWSLREKLKDELSVSTVGDLQKVRPHELARVIGEGNGRKFGRFAKGIDDRELDVGKPRQSVSTEVNYGIRFNEQDQVDRFMRDLGIETAKRLRNEGLQARAMTLKVMQRHPDASVDTPKFLGHGWCITQTATSTVAEAGGRATDNGDIVGEIALTLLKKMSIPIEELRGIGIQLQKLEKDGRSVDLALEKGQGTLSFAKSALPPPALSKTKPHTRPPQPKDEDEPSPSPNQVADPLPAPPPAQQPRPSTRTVRKEPSLIILGDSDDEDVAPAPPPPLKTIAPHVPSLFQRRKKAAPPTPPTTSQVEDEELQHYSLDPEVYRALPRSEQAEVLQHARMTHFAPPRAKKPKQTILRGRSSKSSVEPVAAKQASSMVRSKSKSKSVTPAPPKETAADMPAPVGTKTPTTAAAALKTAALSSTPDVWTDEAITALGLDVATFRELPPSLQFEQAKEQRDRLRTKDSLRVRAMKRAPLDLEARHASASSKIRRVSIRAPIRFAGRTSVDDLRQAVEDWLQDSLRIGVEQRDLERLAAFLEKTVARGRGCDAGMAVELLEWWSILLGEECGAQSTSSGTARTLWQGYMDVCGRVDMAMRREYCRALAEEAMLKHDSADLHGPCDGLGLHFRAGQIPQAIFGPVANFDGLTQAKDRIGQRQLDTRSVLGCIGMLVHDQGTFIICIASAESLLGQHTTNADQVGNLRHIQRVREVVFFSLDEIGIVGAENVASPSHICHDLYRALSDGTFYFSTSTAFDITSRFEKQLDDTGARLAACAPRPRTEKLAHRDVTAQLQHGDRPCDVRFLWNATMLQPLFKLRRALNVAAHSAFDSRSFCVELIQGYCGVVSLGEDVLALISRRGWQGAGTRFAKRGIDADGHVGNFAESETILRTPSKIFSFVQVRGSVPCYWKERLGEGTTTLVTVHQPVEDSYEPFKQHMLSLVDTYGDVLRCVTLLATIKKELALADAYEHLCRRACHEDGVLWDALKLLSLDLMARSAVEGLDAMPTEIQRFVGDVLPDIGWCEASYDERINKSQLVKRQQGVFRVNCRDCLDRTNLAAFAISLAAIKLYLSGGNGASSVPFFESAHRSLWSKNGNALSKIYAGSEGMNTMFVQTGHASASNSARNAVASLLRVEQATYRDAAKERATEILTGEAHDFVPVLLDLSRIAS